ncbi:MAG TPA: hydrogenase maturation protease [Thermoanaerobaculia bacterium]
MARVLVLGYGNTLRGDDGAGWLAAEALRSASNGDVDVRAIHQLGPELAVDVAAAPAVVFVDASVAGPPGQVAMREVGQASPAMGLTHHVPPAAVMDLAEELYGVRPPAWEVAISGASFALGEGLSPAVAARIPALVALVGRLARFLRESRSLGPAEARIVSGSHTQ